MTRVLAENDYCALLVDYAAGTLDEAASLVVASHLTLSPKARRFVSECEELGGILVQECCEPISMMESSLQSVLDRIDEFADQQNSYMSDDTGFPESLPLPRPICRYLSHRPGVPIKWNKSLPGMEIHDVMISKNRSRARLIRMAPGTTVAAHSHQGAEMTLVLEGGYTDETGHYERGDLTVYETETHHRPVADGVGCLCLTVTQAPIRFTGAMALLNIFIR